MIEALPRVVPEAPGRPAGDGPGHPMRVVTEQVAADPGSWDDATRQRVADLFDVLAPEWHTRGHANRHEPVVDALDRGGPLAGPALEVGSGIGLTTGLLVERLGAVLALDLAAEMLALAPAGVGWRVRGDASRLPLPDGRLGTVVLENAFLFGPEVDRVLAPGGAVVWVNSNGERTPIHLPAEAVAEALPGEWDGVASVAGWGTWCVLRRAS